METIYMGLNTEPRFTLPDNINNLPEENQYHIILETADALKLRKQIHRIIKENGKCQLSWECTGRTRHQMHAYQWKNALPEYDFEIGDNYECVVKLKES